jgi:hypothetical protein
MTAANQPVFPVPIAVDLDDITVLNDNTVRIWLRFDGGAFLALDFMPGSEEHDEILEVMTDVISERLGHLGQHGVTIVGMTTADDPEEDDVS